MSEYNRTDGRRTQEVIPVDRNGAVLGGTGSAGSAAASPSYTVSVPVDLVDRSGTTSATPNAFTASSAAANANRQYLRVTNKAASGTLYVWDKTSGTPTVDNTISVAPGMSFVWDTKVPKGAIQVAGSAASMKYEAAEG